MSQGQICDNSGYFSITTQCKFNPECPAGYTITSSDGCGFGRKQLTCKAPCYTYPVCCTLGKLDPPMPFGTCNPKYSNLEKECNSTKITFCAKDNNIFTNDRCKIWAKNNPEQGITVAKSLCNVNSAIDGNPY